MMNAIRTKISLLLMAILAAMLLVACGGESAPVALVDSCALLTKADVEGLLGHPVAEPQHMETGEAPEKDAANGYVSTCNYHTEGDPFLQAGLLARQSYSPEMAKAGWEQARKELEKLGNVIADVSGVGDLAYWDATLEQLAIVKGVVFYIVSADATDGASAQKNAQKLAATILSR